MASSKIKYLFFQVDRLWKVIWKTAYFIFLAFSSNMHDFEDLLAILFRFFLSIKSQHAEWTMNKIEITFNNTFVAWKSMHQGFRIYFVLNPRLKAIETAS